jgi:quercetin dioxygenase-like cupin family protein
MMLSRSPDLETFLTAAEAALRQGCHNTGPIAAVADRIFEALQVPATRAAQPGSGRLPVCTHLETALDHARVQPDPIGALANAFAAIEPQLSWKTRAGAEAQGEQFPTGHANAIIVGTEGLEMREDVRIGVSVMAPHTRYPDHRHPPEEVYVVLSGGEWRQGGEDWHAPGVGGLVHNPPNIVHAMRSGENPLLALWFLWVGPAHS